MRNWEKFGGAPIFVRGHFQEIGIAALPMGLKPRHVERFRECQFTDVEESELTEKKKKKHVQNIRLRSQNGRSTITRCAYQN